VEKYQLWMEIRLPIVLNESMYLIYADPAFIENSIDTARKLQPIIGGSVDDIDKKLSSKSRYVELVKKADQDAKKKIDDLDLKGIVAKEIRVRSYPQAQLAAQVLGFVNNDGEGQYGIEEWLDKDLKGNPGLLKAVTDVHGVPLAGNADNIVQAPVAGAEVTLTIDANIQRIVEDALKEGFDKTQAASATAIVMDIHTGEVKAMADMPTYNPTKYSEVSDISVYKNKSVTDAIEAGSIMKPLTVASAIDQGVITGQSTYYDAGFVEVDGARINNAGVMPAGERSIYEIIRYSLNTGAVYLLKQMGGGEVNKKARDTWHDYLYNHYRFGQLTGIEQPGETKGIIPNPDKGEGLNIQYANTSFGQGIAISPIQMIAAQASMYNGGTYYQPTLIHSIKKPGEEEFISKPKVLKTNVVSKSASDQVISIMEQYAINSKQPTLREGFRIGGKTGTAQIPDGKGGYKEDYYIGTYAGFIGGKELEYAILVTISEPKISGFAGADAAKPIHNVIAKNMMDSVTFKSR
jgi:cell division protein FtsI/penicillin-binding protein 2